MSTEVTLQIKSISSDATERLAERIGRQLRGGEVIELISDLGGGKTTFTRGLAHGMGSSDVVASPTFTISKIYTSPTLEMHHFDFYRLSDPGLVAHELHDLIGEADSVVVAEWAGGVAHVLPPERLTVHIAKTGEERRELRLTYPSSLAYLVAKI